MIDVGIEAQVQVR